MINSGAKVTLEETEEGTVISILPETKPWQTFVLGAWAVVWLFCGAFVMLGGYKELEGDGRIFILVFLAFWAYFLFYAARSLVWNNVGTEFIRITAESMDYKRSWNDYGKVRSYDLSTIKNLGMVNYDDKPFAKTYNAAFWTMGGEMIGFEYIGRKIAFGFKLEEKETKKIIKLIEKAKRNVISQ
ncbi:hypothetical protein N9A49_00790 [Salibacteraceae bacterium]|jgi:hypothetical protein|nr:hypothetical protein [Salibacteraceae bacterium]MDB9709750.1 hypothetical protein [Salibacteraceae bacterium]